MWRCVQLHECVATRCAVQQLLSPLEVGHLDFDESEPVVCSISTSDSFLLFSINFFLKNQYLINSSRTGSLRPTSGPGYGKRSRANGLEHKRKPPRGIYINHDDIVALACPEQANRSDDLLASMDREINALLTQVRNASALQFNHHGLVQNTSR